MERLIFHVDVNSAFLSWEAVKRLKEGLPDLREIPSCIGGDPEKRTSIVLAKSIPAKKYGIQTGEALSTALRKCPKLEVAPPDFRLYSHNSKAFKDICREFAPVVEEFSIDECFLDMTGTGLIYPNPLQTADEIRTRIKEELGFTVNIGIAGNKLLAKMASDFEKPDKIHTLFQDEITAKMWGLSVGELLYCGEATADKLKRAGIRTIGDLANANLSFLQQLVGEKAGKQLHDSANGIDESPVREHPEEAKGYSISTTLEENVVGFEQAERILIGLCDMVSTHMRMEKKFAFCIGVSIRFTDFRNKSHQCSLEQATDVTSEIYAEAKKLLHEVWNGMTPLRLISVSLTNVTNDDTQQLSLFTQENQGREREKKLDRTMDSIRERFGIDSIKRGTTLTGNDRIARKFKGNYDNKRKNQ
ncbi:MAG: DNA polymerase IV [Acetatifactor sp.]|nr:DNA polymerase IV [Acetatifactor sp.]